jgi:hypothetical protein
VTAIELRSAPKVLSTPPPDGVRTIDPAKSPGVEGVEAITLIFRLWPGARKSEGGATVPNGTKLCVDTCQGIVPLTPPLAATAPKMTPVQVPCAGSRTSTLPKFAAPCGAVFAANRPCGSIRIR